MNPKVKGLVTSRKFWAAMVGLFLVVLKAFKPDFPLSETETTNIIYVLIAYILGTAISDVGAGSAAAPLANAPPALPANLDPGSTQNRE